VPRDQVSILACIFAETEDIFRLYSVRLEARKHSSRIQAKGLYVGAKVTRGCDWQNGDQDGIKLLLFKCYFYLFSID